MLSKDLQKLPNLEELRGNKKDPKVQPEEEEKRTQTIGKYVIINYFWEIQVLMSI